MSTKLSQYYSEVEKTKFMFDTALNVLENKLSLLTDEDPDLAANDYSGQIFAIQSAVNQLEILDNIHKFEKITKEQMQYLFSSYDAGLGGGKIVIDMEYLVTSYDTTRTIEQKLNIPWVKIQDYNNILPSQLVPLLKIRIPIEVPISQIAIQDIPTFGDQQGNNILGADLPNELTEDPISGDLLVLSNEESFKQSIQNYFTMLPGSFPYYEEVGFDPKVSDEHNEEERDSILQLRIINTLSDDKRIKNVDISDGVKAGTNLNFALTITAVSGNKTAISI
jgi:hypothetical protein